MSINSRLDVQPHDGVLHRSSNEVELKWSVNMDTLQNTIWEAREKLQNNMCIIYYLFILFLKFIYLFIWLLCVLVAARGIFVEGSLVEACGIFSCGMRTLSCSVWDLVPWPGIEPGPPALGAWSLSHWTTSEVPIYYFFFPFHYHFFFNIFIGVWLLYNGVLVSAL